MIWIRRFWSSQNCARHAFGEVGQKSLLPALDLILMLAQTNLSTDCYIYILIGFIGQMRMLYCRESCSRRHNEESGNTYPAVLYWGYASRSSSVDPATRSCHYLALEIIDAESHISYVLQLILPSARCLIPNPYRLTHSAAWSPSQALAESAQWHSAGAAILPLWMSKARLTNI